eukprot:scaffold5607_cov45-Cyclotella_meneghiniana.AAC.4
MHYFYVAKGKKDIRMVYNGTASGVNDCLFYPHFGLPTINHVTRALAPSYHQADLDVGEMFLNFILGEELRPYSGVDITHLRTRQDDLQHHLPDPLTAIPEWEKGRAKCWERWVRNWMGLRDSPGRSGQMMVIAKEMAYGDRRDPSNPFQWERVVLNLPGNPKRNPKLPWVYKLRADGLIAAEAFIYVDDCRVVAATRIQAWWAARRLASTLSNLGLQDAARKRTTPSEQPGPWAGSVAHTKGGVFLLVTPEKWEKTKSVVDELGEMLHHSTDGLMDRKRLEQIRGFLVYVSRTYPWMPPYLKGLHLTIDNWRPGRDADGFKLKAGVLKERPHIAWEWKAEEFVDLSPEEFAERTGMIGGPEKVRPVSRLARDVAALQDLLAGKNPSLVRVRSESEMSLYLMGDASGKGFGTAWWNDKKMDWESGFYGFWHQQQSSTANG